MTVAAHEELLRWLQELSHTGIPITEESDLQDGLGLDSLDMARLLVLLEEDFGIPVDNPESLRTAGDVLKLVQTGRLRTDREPAGWREHLLKPAAVPLADLYHLDWTFMDRVLITAARGILRAWFGIWHMLEIRGVDRLPQNGPYLICPNHQSYPDPLFLYASLPRVLVQKLFFVGWEGYFRKPPFSWLNRLGHVLPTGGDGRHPECLKLAYDGLKLGKIVCIFPEGGRSTTGGLMKPRLGAGILAHEAGAAIYPVRVDGALAALSLQNPGMHFCKITLNVLEPIQPEHNNAGAMHDYRKLMDRWTEVMQPSGS